MKIVVHICCGVCAAGVVQTLQSEGHEVTGYYCNSNIYPQEEYMKRLEAVRAVAERLGFPLYDAQYVPAAWLKAVKGMENEPEGGQRCGICYRMRLQETYDFMKTYDADAFTTTLTVSPHKPAPVVNAVGLEIAGDAFLQRDFKKKDGFKKAMQQARDWNLYRQNYCGCLYSIRTVSQDV